MIIYVAVRKMDCKMQNARILFNHLIRTDTKRNTSLRHVVVIQCIQQVPFFKQSINQRDDTSSIQSGFFDR